MGQKVLVAGASGLVGGAAVRSFARLPGWEVVAVSRRKPALGPGVEFIPLDLTDQESCRSALSGVRDVTHVVYAALHEIPGLTNGWIDEQVIERNAAMLRNLFEPLLAASPSLEHVSLLHGTKAYGIHHPMVGPAGAKIPLREREPRKWHPNFYFLQEDWLREKQSLHGFGLTVFRPTVIYGDAPGSNMNPVPAIGVYAALQREAGEPLHFPGLGEGQVVREAVDADLVASAITWAATSPAARNETFNLTNGDVFVWQNVWPAIAKTLGMEPGEHRPLSLVEELPTRQAEWASLVDKYGLAAPRDLVEFVGYNSLIYADMMLRGTTSTTPPFLNSTIKARQAGFHDCIDTEDMFCKLFRRLQEARMLPPA